MNHRIVSAGLGALLALSATALAQTGVSGARIADGMLAALRRRVELFGFHLADVEVRVHARDAIDPDDPEALADLVLAGVNEALRSARAGVEAKAQQMLGDMGLGGLQLPGLGE